MSTSLPLGLLEVSGLVRQAGSGANQEYMFRHTLLQETAYQSLLRDERAELHLAVGRALEDFYSGESDGKAAVLAEHFLKGGEPNDAFKYFRQAGDEAARLYALAEALEHYGHALELAHVGYGEERDLEYLYERRGRMLELDGQYEEALSTYGELEAVGQERESKRLQLRGLVRRANLLCLPNPVVNLDRGEQLSKRALQLAEQEGDREVQALALWNLMKKHEFAEEYGAAYRVGQRARKLAEQMESGTQRAFILHDLSQIYLSTGHFDGGKELILQAQSLWQDLDNLPMLADSLCNQMVIHVFRMEFDEALELSHQARGISERIGNLWGQSYSRYFLYWVHFDRGDVGRGLKVARRSIELGKEAGFVVPLVQTTAEIGMMHAYMGQYKPAIQKVEQGVENSERYFPQWRSAIVALKLLVHTMFDELDEAAAMLPEVQAARKEEDERVTSFLEFIYALAVPALALAQGRYRFVLEETDWTLQTFEKQGIKFPLADTLYYRACALLAMEKLDDAGSLLDRSLQFMQAAGSRRRLWSVLLRSAELAEKRGERERAAELRDRAVRTIHFIADHSESPTQREAFLRRPAVRQALEEKRDA